ncbi:MAG: hypothetical protein ACR2JM_00865 [Mycobacterium sp.]
MRAVLIGAFLLTFVLLLGFFNATKPRIMVLHSGSRDSPWVQQVDGGMRLALDENRRPVSVEWTYMGIASPASPRNADEAAAEAHRAVDRFKPDVLIAVDDEANELVAQDYVGRKSPRILYVSIDRPPAAYGYPLAPNVSGIAERMPWTAVRDALLLIFPGHAPTVSVLGVDSLTEQAELAQIKAADWGPVRIGEASLVTTGGAWRDAVIRANGDALIELGTHDLPDGEGVFSAAEASRWTQENSRPLPIGTQVDFVPDGGALSLSPPPDDVGEKAIRLALDWLDARATPGPPPAVDSSHFEVAVREGALVRRGITLPQIYLESARENGTLLP